MQVSSVITSVIQGTINKKWRFPTGPNGDATINKGLEKLKALFPYGISADRMVDYLVYQIYRCRNSIESDRRFNISWLFSDNAISKYKSQFMTDGGKTGINYYIDQWLSDDGLTRNGLANLLMGKEHSKKKYVYIESEEPFKKRHLNTDDGLLLCLMATTGWNPLSETCNSCHHKDECMRISENKYPEIIRLRKKNGYKK